MSKIKVHAWDILRMIPDEEIAKIAKDTKVDYCAKVLTGERLFYLLVFAFLSADHVSQRRLESIFNNPTYKTLFNVVLDATVTHGSISTRLANVNLDFFEKAFELLYNRLSQLYTEKELQAKNIVRIDSSMVAETCNKLKKGFTVGKKASNKAERKQIKYTVAYDGFSAKLAEVFSKPEYLSEDIAMPAVVQELIKYDPEHNNLYVLDRGFCALKNYELVEDAKAKFVGRIKTNRKMQVIESLMTENTNTDLGKLELVDDLVVFLYDREKKDFSNTKYRVIKAKFKTPRDTTRPNNKGKVKRVENEVFFITNDFDMTSQEIAFCYKKRWDIEVYFKFLKQNLNFSHFLSTNENGIKVILYMTIITSMLVMIYKKENELGFSIAKFNFYLEMQEWVGALLVVINGGDLSKTPFRHVTIRSRIP